jgi:hypothetical protein
MCRSIAHERGNIMEGNPLFLAMKPLLGGIVELEQPNKKEGRET